jgi:uncharacterized membrane protein HdeD (DUF308 family)
MIDRGPQSAGRDPSTWWPDPPPVVERVWTRRDLASLWWIFLAHGALALVAGILLLVWPDRTLLLIGVILGVYLVLVGVLEIVRALTVPDRLTMERVPAAVVGLLAVGAGTIAIARPESSVLAVALAAGIYLIVAGLAAGVTAIREPGARVPRAVFALINLAGGILVVAWPDVTVTVVAVVVGIALLVRGIAEIVFSVSLARARG